MSSLTLAAPPGVPRIQPGDDLSHIIIEALARAEVSLAPGDVLVISSKIVSKAEGRFVRLEDIEPSDEAHHYAKLTDKDPRMVELVLRESTGVSRYARGVLVVEHRLGFVSANAGIDQSNIEGGDEGALLLPTNPDSSAAALRDGLQQAAGVDVGVVLSDSHGRPFRMGNVGVAIGVAGLPAVRDLRGQHDLYGRELRISIQGYADMIASAATLLTGEGDEGRPLVLVRGLEHSATPGTAADLNRPAEHDLYR